ncbi:MAG: 1-(5-phosphoribosyl)-5-[(5-phosphoribosylamino)methylideneamino]imidazole-4-carboxamide isomerase [Bacteroidia bacterium]
MNLIPAIDLIEGKCVRLTKGDYAQMKVYNEDPLEVALMFQDAGIKFLHLVDLDGAKAQHIVNWKVLEKIASKTNLKIDFGGGIKSDEDIEIAFNSGADKITAGSIAVKNKSKVEEWIIKYSSEKIILGADVNNEQIAVSGWQEQTSLNIFDFLDSYLKSGIQYCICTDISKDGMLQGPSIDLYKKIIDKNPMVKLIASGGISSLKDLDKLKEANLYGAIIGKAIYEGKISLKEISMFNH